MAAEPVARAWNVGAPGIDIDDLSQEERPRPVRAPTNGSTNHGSEARALEAHDSSWTRIDVVEQGSKPREPPDVGELFYTGLRHLVSGTDESLKTWLMLVVAADELHAERAVLWIDFDAMGATDLLERLRALGVPDDLTRRLFIYVAADEPINA